jgi:cytochrome c-type biogenesis protein
MELLQSLSAALSGAAPVAVLAAFAWGFASIWMSPCHLAGVPLVVGYLAGGPTVQRRPTAAILAFALGVLASLVPLGAVTLLLGRVAGDLGISSNYLVAAICVLAGLYLLDWLPLEGLWRWLARVFGGGSGGAGMGGLPRTRTRGPAAALFLGLVFGLALGPCAFAWIAPVLGLAWMEVPQGLLFPVFLLVLFALGHVAGVLLAAGSLHRVQRWLDTLSRRRGVGAGRALCGGLLLAAAVYLLVAA